MPQSPEREKIEVIRDSWGIPHVFAEQRRDAWFGQGWVHATDRLWQMVLDRYRAQGRSSELIGARGVRQDTFVRRIGLYDAARADLELLEPDELAIFAAYCEGVNAAIAGGARAVELELLDLSAAPWTPTDCLAVWKVRHVFMGSKGMKLWRQRVLDALGPDAMARLASADGREEFLIVPPGASERWVGRAGLEADATDGSNSWALDGTRTASGAPMLAGDPHRILETPNVYAQMQLTCDAFDVVGLSVPGVPGFPHFGHNGRVAWCITHAMADDQDLYVERFDAEGRYWTGTEWREPTRQTETIEVWDGEDVEIEIVRTPRGPVVFGATRDTESLAVRWVGSDEPRRGLACLGRMLEARSAAGMDDAMREWVLPCNAMLIGDDDGEIRFLHRGRVPIRPAANGWLPVPGWDEEHEWNGDVPFDELPREIAPDAGWIVTANNRVVGASYPYYIGMDYAAPNRVRRIIERIRSLERPADREAMEAIHADSVSLAALSLVDQLLQCEPPMDAFEREAWDLMLTFDGELLRDDPRSLISDAFRDAVLAALMAGNRLSVLRESPYPEEPIQISPEVRLGSALQRLSTQPLDEQPAAIIFGARSPDALLRGAFTTALDGLRLRFGDDISEWRYDAVHVTNVRHVLSKRFPDANLDAPSVSVDGGGDTVCVSASEAGYGVYHAAVARYVFDLADRDAGGWIVPLGVSADPNSVHHTDQQAAWAQCELIPIVSDRAVLRAAASEIQLVDPPM